MSNTGPQTLTLTGGKRGACDRCRGQKLRCIREDPNQKPAQATCIRCFKAGATCSYGIAKRAGRLPASSSFSKQGRKENASAKSRNDAAASKSAVNTRGLNSFSVREAGTEQNRRGTGNRGSDRTFEDYSGDQEKERENEDTTLISPLSLHDSSNNLGGISTEFSAYSAPSTANLPWIDEIMPLFFNYDTEEGSSLDPFGSKYGWAFNNYRSQPMEIPAPTISTISDDGQPKDTDINAFGMLAQSYPTESQISGGMDEGMDLDMLPTVTNTTSFRMGTIDSRTGRVRDQGREWALSSESLGMSSIANLALCNDSAQSGAEMALDKQSLPVNDTQHRRMQEVSRLAMDLYAQLTTNDPENHPPSSGLTTTTPTFQDQLIGGVLKSSNTFLTLINSFSASATVVPSPFLPSPPSSSLNPTCESSDNDTSPSAMTLDFDNHQHTIDQTLRYPHRKPPSIIGTSNSSQQQQPPLPIDMATILQLLTCYIHILHLHSIMHARILDYLVAFLQHNTQNVNVDFVPPIFPDMQVGGVSLDRFGTFQVKLLLEVSVHVLGEIETALGLPKEFRVGKSKGRKRGVLGASVSAEFVKCLMDEGTWRGKKVESVREQLGNLRRVLTRAIDLWFIIRLVYRLVMG